jgi:glycosyltransferase involved in cell wall biosynthesis
MLLGKRILVVIPFFNEEKNIDKVIITLPDFVDYVVLIDDGSTDSSLEKITNVLSNNFENSKEINFIKNYKNLKIKNNNHKQFIILKHNHKKGKGSGIQSGYEIAIETDANCIATMDGDGQMDPNELIRLCLPIVNNDADYAKGNRLSHPDAFKIFPFSRYVGLKILTFLNKFSSGYYNINDSQTGFTAISKKTLLEINIKNLYKEYGYPNDMLTRLNINNAKVIDVPITPIYPKEGKSKMKILEVIPKISFLLLQLFIYRIKKKYFHL